MRSFQFRAIIIFLLLFVGETLSAQYYLTGEAPARIKWNQIKTPHYKVIYPQGADSLAQRYSWLLESERNRVMAGLDANPKRIPVVLQPYTTVSNGMVSWAPKRMELYTCPPANNDYYQNWERQLVLHESRHVGQMSLFTKGVFKPLGWLFGEQITGLGVGVYSTKWQLEGDAVVAETELTDGGRGRSASFMEYYRASFLSGKYRNWARWRYGSYKEYAPNGYSLGYLVNSTARMKSDNYLYMGELFQNYVRHFYNFNVFDIAEKKLTGTNTYGLLTDGITMYTKMWNEDFKKRGEFTEAKNLKHKKSGYYYEYKSPVLVGADTVICIKYSYDNPTDLVMLSSNEEFLMWHKNGEKILRPFSTSTSKLEKIGKKIYWTETIVDERWCKEAYNNLYSYDLKSGEIDKLSGKTSYNNPSASPCGSKLSVVEYPYTGDSNLVILSSSDGTKLATYPSPCNGQITETAWIGETIYALVVTDKGLGMFAMEQPKTGEWRKVIEEQPKAIRSLRASDGYLYFESDIDGVNNIYSFNPKTEKLERIVNSKFGAHEPYIADNKVYYSELYLQGMEPAVSEIHPIAVNGSNDVCVKEGKILNDYKFEIADKLSEQANSYFKEHNIDNGNVNNSVKTGDYKVKRYRKGTHLFRFHSWAPVYYNVDRIMTMSYDHFYDLASLGATVYSQNSLGTAVTMLGYSYRKGYHAGHASFEYSGLYPVFKVEADYNTANRYKYRMEVVDEKLVMMTDTTNTPFFDLRARVYLPISFNSFGWQRGFIPQISWNYTNNAYYSSIEKSYANRQLLSWAVQYYQMRPIASGEIFPKWGFNLTLKGAFAPNGREYFGSTFALYSYLYMPGFLKDQGIRLSASYQKQNVRDKLYYSSNLVSMPRGYNELYGTGYYNFSIDYAVPVNFKGLDLGFLAYIYRMQFIPFAEMGGIRGNDGGYIKLPSAGIDVLVDAIVCRIGYPISLGVRYARTNQYGEGNHIGFLFNISLP